MAASFFVSMSEARTKMHKIRIRCCFHLRLVLDVKKKKNVAKKTPITSYGIKTYVGDKIRRWMSAPVSKLI